VAAMVKLQQFAIGESDEVHHRSREAIQQLTAPVEMVLVSVPEPSLLFVLLMLLAARFHCQTTQFFGVTLDCHFSLDKHICKSAYYHIFLPRVNEQSERT